MSLLKIFRTPSRNTPVFTSIFEYFPVPISMEEIGTHVHFHNLETTFVQEHGSFPPMLNLKFPECTARRVTKWKYLNEKELICK